uniref:Oxidative stress induced growth inhibitor 1 n=1 Tax=Cyanoderma ruficeps TaxID=181631 RepID=A0A8C3XGY1_9PASS
MLPDGKMCPLVTRPSSKSGPKTLPVVIIGNGPSGICLSYLLSGYTPYFKRHSLHPHPILQRKLEEAPEVSVLDQDLEYLSEGLEGRSHSPVALLFDTLQRPDTDFGGTAESVLSWWHEPDRAIPHLVLGRKAPGGAWHSIEGSMVTLSKGEWMGLPDLPFKEWLKQKRRGLKNNRATAEDIAQYYQHYVMKKGLQKNFRCGTVVTSVRKVSAESISNHTQKELQEDSHSLWNSNEKSTEVFQVDGFFKTVEGDKEFFSIYAENVVLATGTYDNPTWLGVKGENLSYVHHQLSALEEAVKNNSVGIMSDPVLILPKMMYPEYHKVHQMMKEQTAACAGPYECYISLPEHHVLSFGKDKKCILQDKNGCQKAYKISMALVLTGSNPNLSFLPNNGIDLAIDSDQPVNSKRNPIDVDPFTYECTQEKGLYALGPLAGDNFVRFVQGGALAAASSLVKKANKNPP